MLRVRALQLIGTFLVMAVVMFATRARGQTTAFTYQGQLSASGSAANGSYDLRFALFDAAETGAPIGTAQTVSAVQVSGGVFTVQLDFGVSAFPGANRFLEIAVRPAGAGSFTTLAPRQQISSSPYSIRTLSAATADALSSACVGCVQNAQINSVAGSKINGAIPAASVPPGSGNYIQNATTPQAGANFNIAGNGVVGGNLTVAGTLNANVGGNFIQNRSTQQTNANFNIDGDGTIGGTLSATNAGIGTAVPNHRLRISGGPPWTDSFWSGALELDNGSAIGWHSNTANNGFGIGHTNGGLFFFHTASEPGTTGNDAISDLAIADSGSVGLGTDTPGTRLDVRGHLTLDAGGSPAIYTAAGDGEFNRYLVLVNSPKSPSASGLKAGGILVADSYFYANPGKNDLVVKGAVSVGGNVSTAGSVSAGGDVSIGGNAIQSRTKGGFVKAMAYISDTGAVFRCYNSQVATPCVVVDHPDNGVYRLNFGFQINDRFVSVTAHYGPGNLAPNNMGANFDFSGTNTVDVITYDANDGDDSYNLPFMIFVY